MFGLSPSFLKSISKHPGMLLGGGTIGSALGKNDTPPAAPDYTGAANATAAGNVALANATTKANRVNQNTPWGSQTYTYDGPEDGGGTWTLDTTLDPSQQQLLDMQNKTSLGLGDSINSSLGRVNDTMKTGLDLSSLPANPTTADNAGRDAMTASILDRMQPGMDRTRQQTETQLLTQGHNRGGEAWNAKQDDLNRSENDARLGAIQAGGAEQSRMFGLGTTARQNALGEQQTVRNDTINTLGALRTGSQVQNPTFGNVPQQQGVAGPDLLGAATATGNYNQGIYNAKQAGNAATTSGLFQLGSAGIMASDRRLKKNIQRIGTHALGIGVYIFDYIWGGGKQIGVMADEVETVMPDAVIVRPDGFKMVNYSMIGGV